MTKATTPFKMFYVELPAAKPFTAKTVRCYLDLETGNIYGSKEVISRFLKKSQEIHNSVYSSVVMKAQELMDYYWNKDNKGSAPAAWIRGKVVKRFDSDLKDKNPLMIENSKSCGRYSKLEFILL